MSQFDLWSCLVPNNWTFWFKNVSIDENICCCTWFYGLQPSAMESSPLGENHEKMKLLLLCLNFVLLIVHNIPHCESFLLGTIRLQHSIIAPQIWGVQLQSVCQPRSALHQSEGLCTCITRLLGGWKCVDGWWWKRKRDEEWSSDTPSYWLLSPPVSAGTCTNNCCYIEEVLVTLFASLRLIVWAKLVPSR